MFQRTSWEPTRLIQKQAVGSDSGEAFVFIGVKEEAALPSTGSHERQAKVPHYYRPETPPARGPLSSISELNNPIISMNLSWRINATHRQISNPGECVQVFPESSRRYAHLSRSITPSKGLQSVVQTQHNPMRAGAFFFFFFKVSSVRIFQKRIISTPSKFQQQLADEPRLIVKPLAAVLQR